MKPKNRTKPFNWRKLVSVIVFASLVVSAVGVTVIMALAPTEAEALPDERPRSDYVLVMLQCYFGIVAMLLPGFLAKKFRVEIPSTMMLLYVIFIYCAIVLGEVGRFYYTVPNWDTMLHTFSGAALGALGFSMLNFLNKTDRVPLNLSPAFVAVFTFCFALSLGALWEIYEFTMDGIFKTNMQKFALENGTNLVGHAALRDTMKDIIVDSLGALTIAVIGYFSIKLKKGWIEKLQIRFGHRKPAAQPETDGEAR